jgi:hypothetical protein
MSRSQRTVLLGLAAAVVVIAVVVAIASGGSNSSSSDTVSSATVNVVGAKPEGGIKTIRFKKGGTIDLKVHSDTADEVHFHGYDVHEDVTKGGTVEFRMPAKIEGKFVVELEEHKEQIASVEVVP